MSSSSNGWGSNDSSHYTQPQPQNPPHSPWPLMDNTNTPTHSSRYTQFWTSAPHLQHHFHLPTLPTPPASTTATTTSWENFIPAGTIDEPWRLVYHRASQPPPPPPPPPSPWLSREQQHSILPPPPPYGGHLWHSSPLSDWESQLPSPMSAHHNNTYTNNEAAMFQMDHEQPWHGGAVLDPNPEFSALLRSVSASIAASKDNDHSSLKVRPNGKPSRWGPVVGDVVGTPPHVHEASSDMDESTSEKDNGDVNSDMDESLSSPQQDILSQPSPQREVTDTTTDSDELPPRDTLDTETPVRDNRKDPPPSTDDQAIQDLYQDVPDHTRTTVLRASSSATNNSSLVDARRALQQAKHNLKEAQFIKNNNSTTSEVVVKSHPKKAMLQRAKAKLREAQERFKGVRKTTSSNSSPVPFERDSPLDQQDLLPPITALQTNATLVINDIGASGPEHLVRIVEEVGHEEGDDDDAPSQIPTTTTSPPPSLEPIPLTPVLDQSRKKSESLQQNLLLLKRKLELKLKTKQLLRKRQRAAANKLKDSSEQTEAHVETMEIVNPNSNLDGALDGNAVDSTNPDNVAVLERHAKKPRQSKDELMKRQLELQQTMDVAYWKRFVAKQKKLLEAQQRKIEHGKRAIEIYDKKISFEMAAVHDSDLNLQQLTVRYGIVDTMVATKTMELLTARQALYQAKKNDRL